MHRERSGTCQPGAPSRASCTTPTRSGAPRLTLFSTQLPLVEVTAHPLPSAPTHSCAFCPGSSRNPASVHQTAPGVPVAINHLAWLGRPLGPPHSRPLPLQPHLWPFWQSCANLLAGSPSCPCWDSILPPQGDRRSGPLSRRCLGLKGSAQPLKKKNPKDSPLSSTPRSQACSFSLPTLAARLGTHLVNF